MTDASARTQAALAPIQVRRDREIYAKDGGWFRARWHFSFDEYSDAANMGIGTLRVFNHDTLVGGAVWPMHPHRDVEGITYVVAGEFEHADSLGNGGVLLPGGVQRMTLGSGAYHSERNHSQTEEMQFIQMWIMPSERGLPPSVEQRQYSEEDRRNRLLRILRPEGSDGEGVGVHRDVSMYVSQLERGVSVEHQFEAGRGGYLYLISGAADVSGEPMSAGDAAYVRAAGLLKLSATSLSELLIVDTPL
jgi:quercetin 2,3-dioxygenase